MIQTDHPAIEKIIAHRQKQVEENTQVPSISDPPLFKKASKLLDPPLFNKLTSMSKKIPKSIGPVKSVPEPQSPTKPTKIPHKFKFNHTSDSWKP